MRDANLHSADLRGSILIGTDFKNANLESANIDGAYLDRDSLQKKGEVTEWWRSVPHPVAARFSEQQLSQLCGSPYTSRNTVKLQKFKKCSNVGTIATR